MELQLPSLVLMAILCGGNYDVSGYGITNGCADDTWSRIAFVVVVQQLPMGLPSIDWVKALWTLS